MKTIIVKPEEGDLFDQAVQAIRQGQLVAFPTETVYGLGANAQDPKAVLHIFEAKGRPSDNPLIVHVADKAQIPALVRKITPLAQKLMNTFMPGPITLVFEKSDLVPCEVTAGLDTVAIRIPSHPVARLFLKKARIPVAAPSANVSGLPSTTTASHVLHDLEGRIPYIIDGGACDYGVESTVVDVTGEVPVILRPGTVTAEQIHQVCGSVSGIGSGLQQADSYAKALSQDTKGTPMSPGMKYRHYSPKARVVLADAPGLEQRIILVKDLLAKAVAEGKRTGVFACAEIITAVDIPFLEIKNKKGKKSNPDIAITNGSEPDTDGSEPDTDYLPHLYSYGPSGDIKGASAKLFSALREMDDAGIEIIIAEASPVKGIGVAYMNRLLKSAGINLKE